MLDNALRLRYLTYLHVDYVDHANHKWSLDSQLLDLCKLSYDKLLESVKLTSSWNLN